MENLVQKLLAEDDEHFPTYIALFLEKYGNVMKFYELDKDNLRKKLWEVLISRVKNGKNQAVQYQCLAALRILSRDKTNLEKFITDEQIGTIIRNAGLVEVCTDWQSSSEQIILEALKLLCNLLFNSSKVQKSPTITHCLPFIIERINDHGQGIPYEIRLFDLRLLFLLTALNISTRKPVRLTLNGDVVLIKVLTEISRKYEKEQQDILKDEDTTLTCEILKILFNLYVNSDKETKDEDEKCEDLGKVLYKFLVHILSLKPDDLQSNIVNLLTVIPFTCYSFLIPPSSKDSKITYQDRDMSGVFVILQFLDNRLNIKEDLVENLSPVLTALIRLVKSERLIRKYVRQEILPPLKDVMNRPEEGTNLRGKLCKLLTSPITEVRDLVAELLFILCKERVGRMVKYTGYGNAAGMFAAKGLLGRNLPKTNYSSESEDSDTEEYLKYKEKINPVTGCYEETRPSPLDGMSEEQKEYEAMKLVGLVDQLTRQGIVQPCRIGEDGKPKPIDHVLELQDELPKQQLNRRNSEDSD